MKLRRCRCVLPFTLPFFILIGAGAHAQTSTATTHPARAATAMPVPEPPPPIIGTIVSVRGDIVQVRQRYLKGVSRFLTTPDTVVLDRKSAPPSVLAAGMHVIAYGPRTSDGDIDVLQIRASRSKIAFSRWGPQIGVISDSGDGTDWVQFGGTITHISPLRVADDAGNAIPGRISIAKVKYVDLWVVSSRDDLMIGRKAFIISSQRSSDILLASMVFLLRSPGNPGTIFGQIIAVGKDGLSILPRFGVDAVTVALARDLAIERQLHVDPDTIQTGQTVTVWGGHSADGTDMSQLTAYVIMPGVGRFPGGIDVPLGDPTAAGRDVVGRVLGFGPLILKTRSGQIFTVAVPGQTPTARYIASARRDLRPGRQVMLICTANARSGAALTAHVIVIDASPIVAMGF